MDERLKVAAETGDIDALYALFRDRPNVLKDIDQIQFVDTPLHIAASAGHTHFAVEMISLKPSFGRKLNPDGLSPLHLALQNEHTETVRRLINIDSELIRVQGKERITPLHNIAGKNNFHLLAEFLCACPASVEDLTVRGETVVHIAVKNKNYDAFEVLFGWTGKSNNQLVLEWKDEDGNTALHIAASTNQTKVVQKLIQHVKINDKNVQGLTALDLSEANTDTRNILINARSSIWTNVHEWIPKSSTGDLADFMRSKKINKFLNMKNMSDDMRNVVIVVATLVATTTYQVAVDPPSGIFREDNKTLAVPEFFYYSLLYINSSAFAASVGVIILSLQICLHFVLLQICLYFLIFSYVLSVLFATQKTVGSCIAILAPFVFYFWGFYWRTYNFWLEVFIFKAMSFGRYNPSRFFQMRNQMVGWYTIV